MEDEAAQALAQHAMEPISRPNSTSTSASAAIAHLPGIASLATSNAANGNVQQGTSEVQQPPPQVQPQPQQQPQPQNFNGASPAATTGGNGNNLPTCQNCQTSTTPLWRRDEFGSVLCNACGLFLKLHGRPRPISLKTDVIKSRNRVKTIRSDLQPKKKATPGQPNQQQRKSANGTTDGTGATSMYDQSMPSFMVDGSYQPNLGATGEPRSGSPLNGDRSLETPHTHEQLIAQNSSLKTRVSELDLINELFRGRLSQLEQQEAAARRGQEVASGEKQHLQTQLEATQEIERQLREQLDDSHRRENSLKRRLDELEVELYELKEKLKDAGVEVPEPEQPPAKRPRLASEHPEPSPATDAEPAVEDIPITTEPDETVPMGDAEDTDAPAPVPEPETEEIDDSILKLETAT